ALPTHLRAGENPAARLLSIESPSLPFLAHPGRLRRPLLVERFADQVDRRSAVLLGLEGIGREEGKRRHDRDEQQEYRSHRYRLERASLVGRGASTLRCCPRIILANASPPYPLTVLSSGSSARVKRRTHC